MFDHVRRIVDAAGCSTDDIIKMTVWMRDRSQRAALNAVWLKMFPDPESRPARHTMMGSLDGDKLIECDFIAFIN
jgi:2-iminobutanoate/2-iminopropanoate deaminase